MKSRFEQPGSLPRPGIVGRVVRLLLGVACLQFLWVLLTEGADIARSAVLPGNPGLWFGIAVGLYVTSYVVNIGFTLHLGRWPQYLVVALGIGFASVGQLTEGSVWTPLLGWFVVGWLFYTYAHLGVSFVLSSLLATPGCEMRAIPHLVSFVTRRESSEHFCPGPLRLVDDWELRRTKS